ncbi:MAG: phospholipid carrier-dependent glycosyltransferase [Acidobacteria bacterium]|nr:MAG: phospholipid carrier-dependent glycosyltransferase [Acidobacteriota bacterium]
MSNGKADHVPTVRVRLSGVDRWVLVIPAMIKVALHLVTCRGFGFFSDEFYCIACSNRLDWGYVDHPPLAILLLRIDRWLLGDSLFSIRLLPALVGGIAVLLTGLLARRLGAGRFGQLLAQVCVLAAPVYLGTCHVFSMNPFDVLVWLAAFYILVIILDGGNPRLWMAFGVVTGLGLQNKITVLLLGAGVVVGLILTRQRRQLLSGWFWLGGALAGLIFLPYVLWQIPNGWPTLEFMENARLFKMVKLSFFAYSSEQILQMHPFTFPVWLAGLLALIFSRGFREFQALGWCYLAVLVLFVATGGKTYYLAPAYTMLFAFGAVWFEKRLPRTAARAGLIAFIVAGGLVTLPVALPVLPVEAHIRYSAALGLKPNAGGERHRVARLSQYYASMFGWETLVGEIARVYQALPPEDRAKCGIFCMDYHQAGAIDFLGKRFGLPHAASGHNNYWLWGPSGSGEVAIVISRGAGHLPEAFEEVSQAGFIHDDTGYVQPSENDLSVFVVRKPRKPINLLWPQAKHYD